MGLEGRNGYYVPLVYVVKSQPLVSNDPILSISGVKNENYVPRIKLFNQFQVINYIQGVPPISTHFRFQLLTFLMILSKKI